MATSQVNSRAPSDYSQKGQEGVFDDRYDDASKGTHVQVKASVENQGSASGTVALILVNLDLGDVEGEEVGRDGPRTVGVGASVSLGVNHTMKNDAFNEFEVTLVGNGVILRQGTFKVNSWAQPLVADLTATQIEINVT